MSIDHEIVIVRCFVSSSNVMNLIVRTTSDPVSSSLMSKFIKVFCENRWGFLIVLKR